MQKNIVNKQQGMTFIGLVLVIASLVFVAVIGMKVVPAYMEYMTVKKAVKRIAEDPAFNTMTRKEIITAFDKTASVDFITVIKGSDLVVEKDQSGNIVSAIYQVTIPIVANASVLLDFKASTAK